MSSALLKGVIATGKQDLNLLIQRAKEVTGLLGRDLVKEVTCSKKWQWSKKTPLINKKSLRIVVFDFGVKLSILHQIEQLGCDVWVVPATTSAKEIRSMDPDGVVLSNGPGDPAALPHISKEIKELIGYKPILAICLGHQLLCQALGANTYKLKFGHRGGNQPVLDKSNKTVGITSQNHGFCVEDGSMNQEGLEALFTNLNDGTNEGIRHKKLNLISVQFHPEASPGPHDARFLFSDFMTMVREKHAKKI